MLDAAVKALSQMVAPPFRAVLLRSIGLALLLIIALGLGLYRVLVWAAADGQDWLQQTLGITAHMPLAILAWLVSVLAGLGIIVGSVFLMPAVTALVASFFADDIAAEVERTYYPNEPAGTALPIGRALIEGVKTSILAGVVYLISMPFLLFAGFGALIFFFATAYVLGREYFDLAAMRFRSPADARHLRRRHQGTIFLAGMLIAGFVSIPIVNLATPLFGMALMVHMHKRLAGPRRTLLGRVA